MAILATGNTFADGDQVTSTKLNNIANAATFAADAVDDSTTALSGGKVIIKDGGVTPAKLSTNHPNWDSTGLGVGTSSPTSKLDVETSSSSADGIDINNTSTGDPVIEFQLSGTSKFTMGVDNSDSDKFKIGTTAVETATCLTIDSTGPKLTIGSGAAADTAIIFDGNAQDFYIALDDSADDLLIGLGSTIGTTPAISIDENLKSTFGGDVVIGGTTPTLTIGDAGAEDTAIIFDGNAQDFYIGLDDSADDLIIGVGDTVGTTPAISVTDGRAVTLNTSLTLASGATVTAVLDEDNMASDSATSLATQQSIKAYVDAQVDTADSLSEILAIGNTSGGTDIVLSTTDKTQFRDAAIYIHSSTDGQLDIVADTEIQIAATTIDINGAVALNGAITGATNITLSGELDAATLDISGNADIDGTTNLDAVDIDGAVQIDAIFTSGVDGQGYDTKFFGDTASAFMLWDTSADDLILSGGAGLVVPDGQLVLGSTAVSSTAAELNLLDGSSANTVVNSKAVIYGGSGEVAGTLSTAAQGNVTSLGTLTALTVDDVAINGKVITMTGSTSDTAVLTVGTNGTLSIVTTDAFAAAANIQITADGTVDIDSAGVLTLDSGAAINIEPASGSAILLDGTISVDAGVVTGATSITSTAFVGNVTGNASGTAATVTTAAQPNITSLGTLTALTVDNVAINGSTIGHTGDTDLLTVASGALSVLGTVRLGDGGVDDMILKGATTATVSPGGSASAAIVTTAGTSSGAYHVGVEVPSNDVNDGFYVATDADQDGTVDTIAMKIKSNGYVGILNTAPTTALDVTGAVTVSGGITSTAASNTFGATAFNGQNVTGIQDISLSAGTASATAVTIGNPVSSLCPQLTMTRQGGSTSGNKFISLNTSAGEVFAVNAAGGVTVGIDDAGSDVKFFGATAGSYMLWDESADDLILEQASIEMNVSGDGNGDKAIVINSEGTNFESDGGMIRLLHPSTGSGALTGGYFMKFNANSADKFTVKGNGDTAIAGALSKGSGSFNIEHPLESKKETHRLVHSFIEGPQADLIYRGKVNLVDGAASINIDTASDMTDGTFVVLCRDIQSFTTNESGWTAVRSSVSGNILTIEAQDATCTDSISWMVVGERQDDHMMDTGWTDENGKVIVEPLIPEPEEEEEEQIEPEDDE